MNAMKVERIFFDMDGVLADFDRGVVELCGMKTPPGAKGWKPEDDDEMWARIREVDHFYDRLEPMPGALDLFRLVHTKYQDRCEILTGIPKPKRGIVTAAEDKAAWMHRLFSEDVVVNAVIREDKPKFCKGPDCILMDDLKANVTAWEELGGTGILHISAERTIAALKQLGVL